MSTRSISLMEAVDISIECYGAPLQLDALSVNSEGINAPVGNARGISFASILAFRYSRGACIKLPRPVILAVPGEGTELTSPECGFGPGEARKWRFGLDARSLSVDLTQGPVDEILNGALRGVDGGIELANPRFEGTKACVDVHVWAEIKVLGRSVDFDERFPVCVDLGCYDVWTYGGWATLSVCYRDPAQVYAKLCVGKYGIEKCWDSPTITIPRVGCGPLPPSCGPASPVPSPCGCNAS